MAEEPARRGRCELWVSRLRPLPRIPSHQPEEPAAQGMEHACIHTQAAHGERPVEQSGNDTIARSAADPLRTTSLPPDRSPWPMAPVTSAVDGSLLDERRCTLWRHRANPFGRHGHYIGTYIRSQAQIGQNHGAVVPAGRVDHSATRQEDRLPAGDSRESPITIS